MQKKHWQPLYPLLLLSLSALFLVYKYVLQNFPSVIATSLMSDFHINGLGLGMLSGIYFWTYLIVPLFVGIILDLYGIRWVTAAAIFSCAVGLFIFSKTQHFEVAMFSRALMGVGVSFATIAYMKIAATWFEARWFSLLSGLLVSSAMAGAVFGQMPFATLVHAIGWREALFDIAVAGLVLTCLFALMARDAKVESAREDAAFSMLEILHVFQNPQNWLLMLYSGLAFSPIVIFGGLWGNTFLQTAYHLDMIQASSFISLIFLGLGIGGPVFGILSERQPHHRRYLMMYCTVGSACALMSVLYLPALPIWIMGSLLFLFGFGLGAFSLVFVIGKELNPIHLAGTTIAMINASDALLDAFTEPLVGFILDYFKITNGLSHFSLHAYHVALLILPIYQLTGAALLLWVKEKNH